MNQTREDYIRFFLTIINKHINNPMICTNGCMTLNEIIMENSKQFVNCPAFIEFKK